MIASHILLRVESKEIGLKFLLFVLGPFFLYIGVMFAVFQRVGHTPCLKILLNNFAIGDWGLVRDFHFFDMGSKFIFTGVDFVKFC